MHDGGVLGDVAEVATWLAVDGGSIPAGIVPVSYTHLTLPTTILV